MVPRWRCRCDEQEEAPRLRRETTYIPLDLSGGPQQSGPWQHRKG